jgi:adenosylcobinamide kinase/adenosylcobinamide-phosphate guanylyltransferase
MQPYHHLILGGQRSGKSRHAERLAQQWLAADAAHEVAVVATALASDDEMRQRIDRHRLDRPVRFETIEEPVELGQALRLAAQPHRLLIVDCLTLWLANVLMPAPCPQADALQASWPALKADLLRALKEIQSPVLLVSNEIGLGVIPMGPGVRHFVDEMGWLNQEVAQRCANLTLMVAGQPWTQPVQALSSEQP